MFTMTWFIEDDLSSVMLASYDAFCRPLQTLKTKVDSLMAAGKLFVVDHELLKVGHVRACTLPPLGTVPAEGCGHKTEP